MSHIQRRATALTSEQIAYVRGCQKLQLAVLKLSHKEPLSALHNKFSMAALKKAIFILIEARKKIGELILKNYLKKWQKRAQNLTLNTARKTLLLRARISHIDAFKRFVLSQSFKNWRIKSARSVEDFLNRIGAFWKLMEIVSKKKDEKSQEPVYPKVIKNCVPRVLQKTLKRLL
jgi:hypothetical protein